MKPSSDGSLPLLPREHIRKFATTAPQKRKIKIIRIMRALTDDGKIIAEAAGLGIAEVHSTAVDALVVAPDVVDDELCRLGHCTEVRPGSKHFRRRPMASLR